MDQKSDSSVEISKSKMEQDEEELTTGAREEIAATRMEIGETIEAIQEKLSVASITSNLKHEVNEQIANVVDSTKDALYDATLGRAGDFMKNAANELKKSGLMPSSATGLIPFALIGVGLGALLLKSRRGETNDMEGTNDSSRMRVNTQSSGAVRGAPATALGDMKVKASDMYDRLDETVSDAGTRIKEIAISGKDKYTNFFAKNPLAVGLAAVGVGAAIGFVLPISSGERRLMNPLSRNLIQGLGEKAESGIQTIQSAAGDAISSISTDEANSGADNHARATAARG